jgi:hypothetical protein
VDRSHISSLAWTLQRIANTREYGPIREDIARLDRSVVVIIKVYRVNMQGKETLKCPLHHQVS